MIERLLESSAVAEDNSEEPDESADDMKLTSLTSISDFLNCAGSTLPENIRLWARRNLVVARSSEVTPEEKRHAQRALSIMLNIKWKSNYFESIDPVEARRILDEELFGMESVKQRIIECTDPQKLDLKSNDWRSVFLWLNIVLNSKRKLLNHT